MRRFLKISVILAVCLLLITAGAAGLWWLAQPRSQLPATIRDELTFSPLLISPSDTMRADNYKFSQVDNGVQLFSYIINSNGTKVSVSQYVQPSQFVEVPEYKDRFLSNVIKQSSIVQTSNGVVYIGKASQTNKQLAVMLERGLLVLLNPDTELKESDWRDIGDSLELERISN